jgi:TonB-dependent starch-binding outer membrane protein SusC
MKRSVQWLIIMCLSVCGELTAQSRVITGQVTSIEDGSVLPGVNVFAKGTTNGSVTDAEGRFTINITGSEATVLVFSFIGLKSQEILIGEKTVIDVKLGLDITQLSEIVVTGVGVATEKKKLGIAVESITSDKLPIAPTASIDQALIGKIAGAQIQAINGAPGSDINILLRGVNTLNRGTEPMIIVDGVQMSNGTKLNSLDLSAVDRVEVVQGAAAASIFGAQGANGVIQVFTKKGKAGKLSINVSTSMASNEFLNVGGVTKANLHGFNTNSNNEVIGGSGNPLVQDPATLVYSENVIFNNIDPTTNVNKPYDRNLVYHDHFKEFFTSAPTTNASISIAGGSKAIDFSISASNNKQQSNFKGDGYNDRSNLVSNIGIELAKGLKLRTITQLVYTKNTVEIYNKQDFGLNGLIFGIFNARPFVDYNAKDTKGNYAYYYGDASGVNQTNPNYVLQYNDTKDNKVDIIQSLNLTYAFPRFVDVDLKYGINHTNRDVRYTGFNQSDNDNSNDQAAWVGWYNGSDNTGEISTFNTQSTFQNFLANTTLRFDFEKDFNLSLPLKSTTQVAYDYRNDNRRQYNVSGTSIPLDPPLTGNQAANFRVQTDFITKFITFGYLVSQRFEFGEIAGLSGGFRSDYSSAFGKGSKPFTFPRGDAYFRISSLNFWNESGIGNAILEWKLRAAWGKAGIQPNAFDRYPTLTSRTLGTSNSLYYGPNQPNPNLNVEVSEELEVGTDVTIDGFKGKVLSNITLSATYWKRSTDNAIFAVEAPASTGIGTVLDNAFKLSSKGLQASLQAAVYSSSEFAWNTTINWSKQSSQIDEVSGDAQVVVRSFAGSTNYVLKAGDKVGQLYGWKILHDVNAINPVTGNPFIAATEQAQYEVASNGYVVNKTSKAPYFTQDQFSFGDPFPKFNISFINDFTFRKFLTAGLQFDWVYGNHLYNQTKEWMYRDGIHSDYTVPLSIKGESGNWSAFYRGIYAQRSANGTKDYFYEDASFVRLRNISIGVDFARIFNIEKMSRLQLVLSGRNLLTWTKYTGLDPEISSGTTNSAWDRGTDHNTLPNFRTYQATLNIGF